VENTVDPIEFVEVVPEGVAVNEIVATILDRTHAERGGFRIVAIA
jgi:hypothetical protein